MKPVLCSGLSWFESPSGSVVIYAPDGTLFYQRDNGGRKPLVFTLPKGAYFAPDNVRQIPARKRKLPALPKPEREIPLPDTFSIRFAENPNKCTIFLNHGLIVMDQTLSDEISHTERMHIIFHEIGHYFYKSEHKCDIFAAHCMLILGYNTSQAWQPNFSILRNDKSGVSRKKKVTAHLCKVEIL